MTVKNMYMSVVALIAAAFFAASAHAITIAPNNPVALLTYGVEYTGVNTYGKNKTFTDTYHFQAGANAGTLNSFGFTVTGTAPNFVPTFSLLKFQVYDVTANVYSAVFNVFTTTYPQVGSLIIGHLYDFIVTGKTTNATAGNTYSFNVSAIPVPPALILLVSGLFGAGLMGRRKKIAKSVSI
jgi:hypothetical protein